MTKESKWIVVIDLDDPEDPTRFKLDEKGRLSLKALNTFFPRALGLKYFDENQQTCAVTIERDFLIPEGGVEKYHTFYSKGWFLMLFKLLFKCYS